MEVAMNPRLALRILAALSAAALAGCDADHDLRDVVADASPARTQAGAAATLEHPGSHGEKALQ
jgi:hypothetical protein